MKVTVVALTAYLALGCTSSPEPGKPISSPSEALSVASPVPVQRICPTKDAVTASLLQFQLLASRATELSELEIETAPPAQEMTPLKKDLGDWVLENQALLENCDLLRGAGGSVTFPEIPPALQDLKSAGGWLTEAVHALESKEYMVAHLYIKACRLAIVHATELLSGKIDPKNAPPFRTPSEIKLAKTMWTGATSQESAER